MPEQATILPMQTPVKRMITPEEKEFVSLVAQIIVTQTLQHAKEKSHTVPALQPRWAEQ